MSIFRETPSFGAHASPQASGKTGSSATYNLDVEMRLVSVKFRKKITVHCIAAYADALRADPRFEPEFSEIVDMSEVDELDLKPEEFIRLAEEIDPFSREAKRAFVVRNEIQHHAARMHKIWRTQRSFSVFWSVEAARRWIEH